MSDGEQETQARISLLKAGIDSYERELKFLTTFIERYGSSVHKSKLREAENNRAFTALSLWSLRRELAVLTGVNLR